MCVHRSSPLGSKSEGGIRRKGLVNKAHSAQQTLQPARGIETLTTPTSPAAMTSSRSAARGGIRSNPDLLCVSFNQDST